MLPAVYLSQEYFDANWQTSNPWHAAANYKRMYKQLCFVFGFCFDEISTIIIYIGAGSGVPGGAQAPPELFLAPPEPFEPPLTIKKIMHWVRRD